MSEVMNYPMTRQGVRDLDHPIRPSRRNIRTSEHPRSTHNAVRGGSTMRRGGLYGLLLGVLGGFLAYRWIAGHCPAGIRTDR
jgi:hypothetical protein